MSYEPAFGLVEKLYGSEHVEATARGLVWPSDSETGTSPLLSQTSVLPRSLAYHPGDFPEDFRGDRDLPIDLV